MNELGHVLWLGFLGVVLVVEVFALVWIATLIATLIRNFIEWWRKH